MYDTQFYYSFPKEKIMIAEDKMEKARTILILDHYFFGHLTMKLTLAENDNCPTAMTDGNRLVYSPQYIDTLSIQKCVGLNAHEVMHCAMGHFWRGGDKDPKGWNIACDYEINGILLKENFELPDGALYNPAYDNLSAEQIYNRLPKTGKKGGKKGKEGEADEQSNDMDPGKCGGVMQAKGTKEEQKELSAEWKSATSQAAQMAKKQGLLPGHLEIPINDVLNPPLPWYILLRDFVEKTARTDYNFLRPNRRYISGGIILPSLISEELSEVCIVIDTSGSTYSIQGDFAKEVSAVLASYQTTIRLIYCDAQVHSEEVYATHDLPIKLKPIGGGGTSFIPAFEYIEKKGYTPSCMLFLTDLYGTFPPKEPAYPVMWITPNEDKAPFGMTVKFNSPQNV